MIFSRRAREMLAAGFKLGVKEGRRIGALEAAAALLDAAQEQEEAAYQRGWAAGLAANLERREATSDCTEDRGVL